MFDATAFTGHWPFRRLGRPDIRHLLEDHAKNGIDGGVLSNLDSVFYNDPGEGDAALAAIIPVGYGLAITCNPMLPWAVREVKKNELGGVAVRLFPSYHGFRPNDKKTVCFCRAAAEVGLPVCVFGRMDDARMDYLVLQRIPDIADTLELAEAVPEGRFILAAMKPAELIPHRERIAALGNLWIDTSFSCTHMYPYDTLCGHFPVGRILFGTLFPMQCIESNTFSVKTSRMSEEARKWVLEGNARSLFGI